MTLKIGDSNNPEDEFKFWVRIPEYFDDGSFTNEYNGNRRKEMYDWALKSIDNATWFTNINRSLFTFQNEDDRLLFVLKWPK